MDAQTLDLVAAPDLRHHRAGRGRTLRHQAVRLIRLPDAGTLLAGSLLPSLSDCAIWCKKAASFALAGSVPAALGDVLGASAESRLLKALRSGESAGAAGAGAGVVAVAPVGAGAGTTGTVAGGVTGSAGAVGALPRFWASVSSRCARSP